MCIVSSPIQAAPRLMFEGLLFRIPLVCVIAVSVLVFQYGAYDATIGWSVGGVGSMLGVFGGVALGLRQLKRVINAMLRIKRNFIMILIK